MLISIMMFITTLIAFNYKAIAEKEIDTGLLLTLGYILYVMLVIL